jgi:hypothetical protein
MIVAGSLCSGVSTIWTLLHSARYQWLNIVLAHWWLLPGFAFALIVGWCGCFYASGCARSFAAD